MFTPHILCLFRPRPSEVDGSPQTEILPPASMDSSETLDTILLTEDVVH